MKDDTVKVLEIISKLRREMNSKYNDVWTSGFMKQSLLEIKMAVDKALVDAPEFTIKR